MHFEREHEFAGTVEQVASLMSDDGFQSVLDLPDLARPAVVAHDVDGTVHHLTLRYEYIGQLDPIAQKVVGGRSITWVQDLTIDVATGIGTLGFTADGVGGRAEGSATVTITATGTATSGPSCRRVIDGEFRIRIPLVGGKAEQAIVPGLERRLDVEAAAVAAELARVSAPTVPDAPDLPFRPTVGEALHHAVEHWPDHDFVVTPARHMTYAQAEAESGRLARRMLAAGMGKGTRIGLYLPYGQDWVVAWLAASRIGALVMPLATTYRPAEIRKVLRIGDIDTLLTARVVLGHDMQDMLEASVPGLADATGPRLYLPDAPSLRAVWLTGDADARWATPVDFAADADPAVTDDLLRAVEAEVVAADLAQVTYTSGSSADPKGVVHTHGTVVRATAALAALQTADGAPARFFCAFPFFWIGGTLILGAALQSGATVLVTERFDPGAALDLIEQAQATHVLGWPTLLQAMRDHPSFAGRTLPAIPGLTVGPADLALVGGPVPGIPAHRGMSETVGNIASVGYRVVDPDTAEDVARDVPDGDEGELWVRGYGLMHGYYKQERADVFDADGWFHTGDRVFLHGGRAWFVGRTTEMVKSRGANVAPREVELFLEEEFDEVLYAFVLGLPHPELGEQVAAVLVAARGHDLDPDDIARRAREQISSYKVPTRIDVWDEADVPWLGSGKPDKRAIRERLEAASSDDLGG